jgi:hypothetical protein
MQNDFFNLRNPYLFMPPQIFFIDEKNDVNWALFKEI